MAVFSKTQEGANGRIQVLLRERNGFCFGAPEKTSKPGTSVLPRRLDSTMAVSNIVGTPITPALASPILSIRRSNPGSRNSIAIIAELSRTMP